MKFRTTEQDWRKNHAISAEKPRFLTGTRGRIVTLLRRSSLTVEELAEALDLTDNAVRAQLVTLERDGLVQQQGSRRSSSKPATVYELTEAVGKLFAKAYSPVLRHLPDELNECVSAGEAEALMRSTGRRLAAQWPIP